MQWESDESTETPVCNLNAALERLDGDADLLVMLIAVYREDSAGLLTRLSDAVRDRDAAAAERAAHSLKGLAANFDGFPAVEAALVIETAARQGNWPAITAGHLKLEQEVSRLRQALAEYQPPQ
ncbi:Hpt domain-containing protein [Lacipirellula limnantheis]|uniref:Hpt domain protein n=1 Tax=Lacipirellula limnantheis TaxID=2528024 RepID=A0A517U1H9_9BACT|nr:Hpt domain-containing protein [Lacipirellula limnantheis]QDT74463.1 Hpt domain protein [Lacipirellula limnantheis]